MESTVRVRVLRKGENSLYLEIEGENSRNRPQFRLLELQIAGRKRESCQSRVERSASVLRLVVICGWLIYGFGGPRDEL